MANVEVKAERITKHCAAILVMGGNYMDPYDMLRTLKWRYDEKGWTWSLVDAEGPHRGQIYWVCVDDSAALVPYDAETYDDEIAAYVSGYRNGAFAALLNRKFGR